MATSSVAASPTETGVVAFSARRWPMSACGATLRSTPTSASAAFRRVDAVKLTTRRASFSSNAVNTTLAVRSAVSVMSTSAFPMLARFRSSPSSGSPLMAW